MDRKYYEQDLLSQRSDESSKRLRQSQKSEADALLELSKNRIRGLRRARSRTPALDTCSGAF